MAFQRWELVSTGSRTHENIFGRRARKLLTRLQNCIKYFVRLGNKLSSGQFGTAFFQSQ
jgi:hypothetical protein